MDSYVRPRATATNTVRLTESAGMALWGTVTGEPLDEVTRAGFYDPMAGGMRQHDRIFVTASADGTPQHATLVVVRSNPHASGEPRVTTVILDRYDAVPADLEAA